MGNSVTIRWSVVLLISLLLFLTARAQAQTNRFSTLHHVPAKSVNDYITTLGSGVLNKNEWRVFTQFDYGYHPLEATNSGARVRGITDHLFIEHAGFAVSLIERTEFEIMLPVIWYNRFSTPDVLATNFSNKTGIGDLFLRARISVLDTDNNQLGLGVVPFFTLPTGNENHYVSDKNATGGFLLVLDRKFSKKLTAGLNLGFTARESISFLDYTTKFLWQSSIASKMKWTEWLSTSIDLYTKTKVKTPFKNEASSPMEAMGQIGIKIPDTRFTLSFGGGYSILRGAGSPKFRGILGLSYGPSGLPDFQGSTLPASSY